MNGATLTTSISLFAAAILVSLIGVAVFTRWSRHRGLLDVPNERSSHSIPTPRGGGLILVLICLTGYLIIGFVLDLSFSWGYFAGGLVLAIVSWLDDLFSLPFWSRLIFHLIAGAILISDVGFWSRLSIPLVSGEIVVGTVLGVLLTLGWVVWLLNAYNFMDGIDGIAALQSVISCCAWLVLASIFDLPSVFLLSGVVASASAGFLIHNWHPAKIFMGDVGSAFLGFTLAAMPLLARYELHEDLAVLPLVALLFVWFFVFDTVFTLCRRLLGRRRIWEAHREHIYQKLVMEGRQHSTVALYYGFASTLLAGIVLLALSFSGIYWFLGLLSLVALTSSAGYIGIRKKS